MAFARPHHPGILTLLFFCPFSDRRWHLHGLITLEYLPAWAIAYTFCEKCLFRLCCEKLTLCGNASSSSSLKSSSASSASSKSTSVMEKSAPVGRGVAGCRPNVDDNVDEDDMGPGLRKRRVSHCINAKSSDMVKMEWHACLPNAIRCVLASLERRSVHYSPACMSIGNA